MAAIRVVELNAEQRQGLEKGYRRSTSGTFSRRCHLILLKSEGRTSAEVGKIVGMNQISVNKWLDRYEKGGIEALHTATGRGRKQILNPKTDEQKVRLAVQQERQRLSQAKAALETELGKQFSVKTLKRFLKKLSADGSESD